MWGQDGNMKSGKGAQHAFIADTRSTVCLASPVYASARFSTNV